jgi:hypothetical protein
VFNPKRSVGIAICLLLFTADFSVSAQISGSGPGSADPGREQLENVEIRTEGIAPFFAELSLLYDIPIGLETVADERELTRYSIDFKKGTLADLLTQFVSRHSRYTWKIEDGVINVFPKDGYRDLVLKELLAVKIQRFSVKEKTSCWDLVKDLLAQPEAKTVLAANESTFNGRTPSGFYIQNVGRSFALEVSNVPLKSILSKVISKSSTAKFWVISRNADKTLLIDISARHEDSLRIKGKRPLQDMFGVDRPIFK